LKDHHNQTHDTNKEAADNIVEEMGDIVEQFSGLIPGLGQSVDNTVMDIRAQADRMIATRTTNMKRANQQDTSRPQKKQKNSKAPQQKGRKQMQHQYQRYRPRGR